ncbi:LacI family DNA-binding transcriptional regulator [Celerinatantimonas sp. MCCC 1A17872]|uniref:LacI family DNA-binding transcriptional regulator n=1 Tax=Celerinatantimonas sp. MCCC 1A17872 TaxID=3177514 RepID=UPI0038C24FE6
MAKRSITAQDVALHAGVSRAVVSRTLSNNGCVAKATRQKVLDAAHELGYQVNMLAQSLNRQRSMLIGVITSGQTDPYRSQLLEDLVRSIQAQNYQALLCDIQTHQDLATTLTKLTQFRVSGVIVTSGHPSAELVSECVKLNIPVVVINRSTQLPQVDEISSDNTQGAQLAINYLKKMGCQRLQFLGINNGTYSAQIRQTAWQRLEPTPPLLAPESSYEGGIAAARVALQGGLNFDGLWCANDLLACGFADCARFEFKLKLAQDFYLVGFDDIPSTHFVSYQLTTLRQNTRQIAALALSRLSERASAMTVEKRIDKVDVKLIIRNS